MPDWLPDFLNSNLLYGPFYQISSAIWNIVMTVCTGIMTTTPQGFSVDTWEYVQTELYPWALAIGVMSMDLFIMIGFFRAVGNFKENMTLELMIEVFIKIVILNVLMVSNIFNSYNIGVDDNCLFDPHYSNCSDCFHINQYYSNYNYDSGFNRRGRKNCADCIAGRK